MNDLWNTLEQQSRDWSAIRRQGLADAIWAPYVQVRFRRTGDPRALEYLYPYLSNAKTRHHAIRVAAQVFEGRGRRALEKLTYFTQSPDLFIRDRAVNVVSATVTGSSADLVLEHLRPYLQSPNRFVRKQAVTSLGRAARGLAEDRILAVLQDTVEKTPGLDEWLVRAAMASLYRAAPTDEVFNLVMGPKPDDPGAQALLIQGADQEWFDRLCEEVIDPMLNPERLPEEEGTTWARGIRHREAVDALSVAGLGRGMEPLERMLRVRFGRSPIHYMLDDAGPRCFIGASIDANVDPLTELAKNGDVPTQRVAAVCLGRLTMGAEHEETISVLTALCAAKSQTVRAAALRGISMAARSTCDEELRRLCNELAAGPETAREAIRALGAVYLGSGRSDVLEDIRSWAAALRLRPVRGRPHSKPLASTYFAAGLVYVGTGSTEPVEFLLDGVARPQESLGAAARGLVMIEFPEAVLGDTFLGVPGSEIRIDGIESKVQDDPELGLPGVGPH